MLQNAITFLFTLSSLLFMPESFKSTQLTYQRVRLAYAEKEQNMQTMLQSKSIQTKQLNLYLRAFKVEQELELWGKNKNDKQFKLLKTYQVCQTSGKVGPKKEQGDLQIPEGFYHIDRFNPVSSFHLSLGINYPNKSDQILGVSGNLGGDIFIHGACVTVGCLPITDDQIKELYIFCVEAKNNGQQRIPVTIFPSRLSETNYESLLQNGHETNRLLWSELKTAYDLFNSHHQLPNISFETNGRHTIRR